MFQTQDKKKKFGSAFAGKRYDAAHPADEGKPEPMMGAAKPEPKGMPGMGESSAHEAAEKPEFEKGEQEGMNEAPEQVAQEHGSATTVHVSHDHKSGKHHVVSTHPDGHVHTSDHASAGEAHSAAGKLSGGDQPPAEGMGAPEAPEPDGFSLPKLA
jgi:hypothetical protein